jgi:hypothetical protein
MRLWDRNRWAVVGCVIAGSTASALLIAVTDHKIVAGHRESARMVLSNILAFSALTAVLIAYLHTGWSSWKTDLLAGGCAGFVLDRVQSRQSPGRHTLAMLAAGGCGLALIRLLAGMPNWPVGLFISATVITLIVVALDYVGRIGNPTHGGGE